MKRKGLFVLLAVVLLALGLTAAGADQRAYLEITLPADYNILGLSPAAVVIGIDNSDTLYVEFVWTSNDYWPGVYGAADWIDLEPGEYTIIWPQFRRLYLRSVEGLRVENYRTEIIVFSDKNPGILRAAYWPDTLTAVADGVGPITWGRIKARF